MENRKEDVFIYEYDSSKLERGYEYREHFLQKIGDRFRVLWKQERRTKNNKDITITKKKDFKDLLKATRFIDKRTGKLFKKYSGHPSSGE